LSIRAASVGPGLGITGGGFVEIGDIFAKPVGYLIETAAEAWRETKEENKNFERVFPLRTFLERAQSIATMHIRVNDGNGVHGTNFFALTVTDAEWDAVAALEPGEERDGSLKEIWCNTIGPVSRLNPEECINLSLPDGSVCPYDFYHKHERRAFGHIAWHVQHGRLWPST
jgi:hypothetical protein